MTLNDCKFASPHTVAYVFFLELAVYKWMKTDPYYQQQKDTPFSGIQIVYNYIRTVSDP